MHEGPTSILYLPSEHGMRIGETLGKITKNLPLEARDNLANLVSLDPERARQALMRYEGVVDEAQQLAGRLPTGSLDAKKVENALKMVNSAMDKLQPVVDAIKENPLPGALITGGGTGFLLNKLQSKTASTHHADAFIRGFERAVQK
jgi:hypothetical protein